jgi:hypothetical protein
MRSAVRDLVCGSRPNRFSSIFRLRRRSDMVFRFVVCACLCSIVSALVVAPRASQPFSDVEAMLARTCGGQCIALLHAKSALLGRSDAANVSRSHALMSAVAEEAGRSLEQAVALVAAQRVAKRDGSTGSFAASGVACSTPAGCAMKTLGANRCNYARVALQQAYNELNVATHALGVLVSSLCGCLHSGHVSSCAMRGVPPACTFPYTVYAKAFAGSAQVWEAVKASTSTCILHGDAGLLQ